MSTGTLIALIIFVAAIISALPFKVLKFNKRCMLGYKALCSFTPISTGIMIFLAIIIFFIGNIS